jgi:hypothetical protein
MAAAQAAAAAIGVAAPPPLPIDRLCTLLGHAGISNTGPNPQNRLSILASGFWGLASPEDLHQLGCGSGGELLKGFNAAMPRTTPLNRRVGGLSERKLNGLIFCAFDFHRRQKQFDEAEIIANPNVLFDYETTYMALKKLQDADNRALPRWYEKGSAAKGADDWRIWKEAAMVALQDNYGQQLSSLKYICNDPKPDEFDPEVDAADEAEKLMYQLRREGPAFRADNEAVWNLLHAAFVNTVGYAWIKDYESAKDGEGAWQALLRHFEGEGEEAARSTDALRILDTCDYFGENVKRFDECLAMRTNAIIDLKKLGQEFRDDILVKKLVDSIKVPHNNDIAIMKGLLLQTYRNDYDRAVEFASTRIREIKPRGSRSRGEAAAAPRRIAKTTIVGGVTIDDINHIPTDQWRELTREQQDDVRRRRKKLGKRSRSRSPGRGGRGRGRFGGRGGPARGRGRGRGRGGRGWYNDRPRGGNEGAERQIGAAQRTSQPRADVASSGGAQQQQQPTNNQQSGQPSGRGPQNGARFGQTGAMRPAL